MQALSRVEHNPQSGMLLLDASSPGVQKLVDNEKRASSDVQEMRLMW